LEGIPGGERWLNIQEVAKAGLRIEESKFFRYAKIKGNLLVYVFSHPLMMQEFKMRKEAIKTKMRIFYKARSVYYKAIGIVFTDIHAMLLMREEEEKKPSHAPLNFAERATGDFAINCTDPKLRKGFEDIRAIIKKRNTREE
jgi:hypothetical protein